MLGRDFLIANYYLIIKAIASKQKICCHRGRDVRIGVPRSVSLKGLFLRAISWRFDPEKVRDGCGVEP
jgi:hypothetical protein